jgi:hypothetical protein
MSVTEATIHSATPSGAMPELVAGLAVIVLTILGLAGVAPNFLVALRQSYLALACFSLALQRLRLSTVACLSARPATPLWASR